MMEIDEIGQTSDDINDKKFAKEQHEQEKTIKLHPLAIINISDHYTRAKSGGSPLCSTTPVIGLLFGYQENLTIHIMDSIEMEDYPSEAHSPHIQTNIELHQTVFKNHEVMGWYRIALESQADEQDLNITHVPIRKYNENPLFLLVSSNPTSVSDHDRLNSSNNNIEHEEKQELPILLYETYVTNEGPVAFRNLEFDVDTHEPERIAVDKVFNTQPHVSPAPSQLDLQFQSLSSSLLSLDARITILLAYLETNTLTHEDYPLLRSIDSLLRNYPPPRRNMFDKEFEEEFEDMLVLTGCATVAKTAKAVNGYVEKFKVVCEKRDLKKIGL